MSIYDITEQSWLSEDPCAFKRIPQARLVGARVPARARTTLTVDLSRRAGADSDEVPIAELDEVDIVSRLVASGLVPLLGLQLERAAIEMNGLPWGRWWRALELDRRLHLPELHDRPPSRPGDLDLILGPWFDGPCFHWLVGVEMKRLKFSECAGPKRGLERRLDVVVEQAHGLWELGFDQAVVALLLVIEPEDLPFGLDGSAARNEIQTAVVRRVIRQVVSQVPQALGVVGLLWDAPPRRSPQQDSEVSIYKIRRPGVNPHRGGMQWCGARPTLERSLARILEHAGVRSPHELVRSCPWPACRRPVIIRGHAGWGCPACNRAWASRPDL